MAMRIHRFFIEQKIADSEEGQKNNSILRIAEDGLIHQWRHVLRFEPGQKIILLDNSGQEYEATLLSLTHVEANVRIDSQKTPDDFVSESTDGAYRSAHPHVFLYLALAKRDSFEWTIEKATELGVAGFVPVVSERSEKKDINMERTRNMIKEASEQSCRNRLADIIEPLSFQKSVEHALASGGRTLVLDPRGEPFKAAEYIQEFNVEHGLERSKDDTRVNVFVGPEGGWSSQEIDFFTKAGLPIFSTGSQVLRAETAAVAIASILLLSY